MKKLLTVSFLTLLIVLISGCSLTEQKPVDNSAMTEQITTLQQQMSGFSSQMETLKNENEQLKIENQSLKTTIEENATTQPVFSSKNDTQTSIYTVKIEQGEGNSHTIYVYANGNLIFKLKPIDGLGTYYKIIGNILFVDYGTAVGGRTIKLIDVLDNGKIVFETRYNGEIKIEGDRLYFNFSFYDPQGTNCDNYGEIKNMGGSVNYEQKRYYDFKEDKLVNLGSVYCTYGE